MIAMFTLVYLLLAFLYDLCCTHDSNIQVYGETRIPFQVLARNS